MSATYSDEKGAHQQQSDALFTLMESKGLNAKKFHDPENYKFAIFNGMAGIYYEHFNSGSDAAGAVDNNRVHGFRTLEEFHNFCELYAAPDAVRRVTEGRYVSEATLEAAMDAAVVWTAATHLPVSAASAPIRRSARLAAK